MNHSFAAKPASATLVSRPDGLLVGAPDGSKALTEPEEARGKIQRYPVELSRATRNEKKKKEEREEERRGGVEGLGAKGGWGRGGIIATVTFKSYDP